MNSINGLNFYDALTKFIIGFLITFWWLPEIINCGSAYCSCGISLNAVQTFLYGISCFIAGFVWEAVYNLCGCGYGYVCKKIVQHFKKSNEKECNPRNTIKLYLHDLSIFLFYNTRNNEEWIERAKQKVEKEKEDRKNEYYKAYYENVNDPIGCVKILEAHEAFLRNVLWLFSPITLIIGITAMKIFQKPDIWTYIIVLLIYIIIYIFLFGVWRKIQFKIHELVWEAYLYKKENNQRTGILKHLEQFFKNTL